jgi:hypothetical protein
MTRVEEIGRDQLRRHACERFRCKFNVPVLESRNVVVFRIVVRRPQDALVQPSVIDGGVRSDRFANLWVRSDLSLENASVDLLVV